MRIVKGMIKFNPTRLLKDFYFQSEGSVLENGKMFVVQCELRNYTVKLF